MRSDGTRKAAKAKRSKLSHSRNGARQSAFAAIEVKRYKLTLNGTAKKLNAEETLHQQTFQQALKGSVRAIRDVYRWIDEREAMLTPAVAHLPKFTLECSNPAGADEALILLGLAVRAPEYPRANGLPGVLLTLDSINRVIARRSRSLHRHEVREVCLQAVDANGVVAGIGESL